ncbi:MAG: hypothetical protein ACO239_09070 [Sediminibacterium sp.]
MEESKEKAEKLFNTLSTNGEIEVPFNENDNNSYFGMFREKYGIEWMINFNSNN